MGTPKEISGELDCKIPRTQKDGICQPDHTPLHTDNISVVDSEDDFECSSRKTRTTRKVKKDQIDSESDKELSETRNLDAALDADTVKCLLPDDNDYRVLNATSSCMEEDKFTCEFKVKLSCEDEARRWVQDYNEKTFCV